MSDFDIRFEGLSEFVKRMQGADDVVRDEMVKATNRITLKGEAFAKQRVRNNGSVVTGTLVRSIAATPARWAGGEATGMFGTAVPYASIVEDGRGPITARPGKVLRFKPKGSSKFIFRKRVGPARAKPFIEPTRRWIVAVAEREYTVAARRIVQRLEGA